MLFISLIRDINNRLDIPANNSTLYNIDMEGKRKEKIIEDKKGNLLGIDPSSLGVIKPKHLTNNIPLAITILTYLKNLEKQNSELQTENETLKTYPSSYEKLQSRGKFAALFNILATIFISAAINFFTNNQQGNALMYGAPGIIFTIIGFYLNFKSE